MSAPLPHGVSVSHALTLEEVRARLEASELVLGAISIGTTGTEALSPASDYDLVIVLDELPPNLYWAGTTSIDGRLTDLLFISREEIEAVRDLEVPVSEREHLGMIARWLRDGRVLFDTGGAVSAAAEKIRSGNWIVPPEVDSRGLWSRVNYNLLQSRRLLLSDDVVYGIAAEMRAALYGPQDMFFAYFDLRGIPWQGEKAAVRYLLEHDTDYLQKFRRFIAEPDLEQRYELYEQLAARTVEPIGALQSGRETVLGVNDPNAPDVDKTLAFWQNLITNGKRVP
jgi:hypothetical protein